MWIDPEIVNSEINFNVVLSVIHILIGIKCHKRYGICAVTTQLSLRKADGGTLAVNNYKFRPLYWPSSGCTTC